jgi:two-component system, NarL family, sensor kinase
MAGAPMSLIRAVVRNPVWQFATSVLLAAVLVGAGSAYFFRSTGTSQAIKQARVVTATIASTAIEPALENGIVTDDPKAVAALDRVVRRFVVRGDVVRIKLWTAAGRIVYSDEKKLIGSTYPLDDEDLETIRTGKVSADISDLRKAENQYERGFGKLLQVYLRVRTPNGRPLLFETYQRYSSVAASGYSLWLAFLPILLGALALLAVVQLSLAWSLTRRLRSGQQERERLLLRAIQASNTERRRIAADLHDSVVQDLAGISLSLGAAAGEAREDETRSLLERGAAGTRQSIRRLRSLLVDIYPPNLQAEGLPAALSDLLEPLSERQVETSLDVQDSARLSPAAEQLVFRCAQEALRNVAAHADAQHVAVTLAGDNGRVRLTVEDDGKGFTPDDVAAKQAGGHLGMTLLADAAADFGARFEVDSDPGRGTRVVLEVPVS